ncbi:peptidogalycan biosysnthesis protein [Stenotrophomonas mori]|uniref:GNAT family N-acetyltransferase n=1 Tax=Stenotrophomonas mori TaxID=2871096 RepID=A0ABT0SFA0_9GAMM|nr:peptidogalycan biosysnthesis protein [Stenotrophomonas mori]MCL7714003.1 GNAT family N-acetyltransferase [Stenotrophomonas mori]
MSCRYATALEPGALLRQFVAHPPQDFEAALSVSEVPVFLADYDLTTTLDEALAQRLRSLPGYPRWRHWLRWTTRFIGCTATEYLPVPYQAEPQALVEALVQRHGRDARLLIAKDLALASPLLGVRENRQAAAFAEALAQNGFVLLEGMPLAWVAIDFGSLDEYLSRLSASRRKDIRRKLRARDALEIRCLETGDAWFDDAAVRGCHALYLNVHAQSQVHFDLLTEAYLKALLQDRDSSGRMFLYFEDDTLIGWNLCYLFEGKLVDKYVGFLYPQARERNLYFVSWMHNLQYALDHGLGHYVAGWTDSRIKRYLGASFTPTRHAVRARNPLLRALLHRCAHLFQGEADGGG